MPALPRLRGNLDFMPSPLPDRPGLLIRDPFRFSETTLVIPPPLVPALALFDGERTAEDLRTAVRRVAPEGQADHLDAQLVQTLSTAGFLEDDVFARLRDERQKSFAESAARAAAHAGSAYPDAVEPLGRRVLEYLEGGTELTLPPAKPDLLGIAAPHVSPEGGWLSYQSAYRALGPEYADRTFVILGTSHYGTPDRFGLTRKSFTTPFGAARNASWLIDALLDAAPEAVALEDYCHAVEHSIEFQVVFLQHLFGAGVHIAPILCGAFSSTYRGGFPEDTASVARFLEALAAIARDRADELFFVLGIDLAHRGRRYGDGEPARAGRGEMAAVARRDRERLAHVLRGDARGFWSLLRENQDDLRWCGASPLYSFLTVAPAAAGELLRYEQWNIDEESVVSFGALAFTAGDRAGGAGA